MSAILQPGAHRKNQVVEMSTYEDPSELDMELRLDALWLLSAEREGMLGTTSWERCMLLLVETRFLFMPLSAPIKPCIIFLVSECENMTYIKKNAVIFKRMNNLETGSIDSLHIFKKKPYQYTDWFQLIYKFQFLKQDDDLGSLWGYSKIKVWFFWWEPLFFIMDLKWA